MFQPRNKYTSRQMKHVKIARAASENMHTRNPSIPLHSSLQQKPANLFIIFYFVAKTGNKTSVSIKGGKFLG
jgi:hypothetical protein